MFELDNVKNEAILRDFFIFQSWTSRTQQFCETSSILKLTTSKTKQVCETSSFFELDNIQNEAILRDLFNFCNSARLPSKMESLVQSWQPRTNAFCHFSSPPVESTAPATKKSDARSYEVLHLSRKIILPKLKIWCTKMQPFSGTDLMNMSLVLRLPRKMHPLQIPTPATVFANATIAHFWQRAQSLAHATQNDIWTSKSAPNPSVFFALLTSKCASHIFAPQLRALFRHLNFQKCSEHEALCPFWLGHVLRATTACNFSSLLWPHGSAPATLASLLFDPPEPQNTEKTQCFATFLPFRAPGSSWLSRFWSSFFFSSLLWLFPSLLFICPYCQKFDF